jgi:hypothetical protein
MAKATGPLYSLSASGKLGDAMVYFSWKGLNVVREWLKPANKKSNAQGNQRTIFGGTGRACGQIRPRPGDKTVSKFAQQLIDLKVIPAAQTKQSFMVDYILSHYLTDVTAYASALAEVSNHTSYTDWKDLADSLSVVEFSVAYDTIDPYDKALGLYLMAKAAIALGFTGTPYTTPLASWVTADIVAFGSHLTGA